MFDDVLLKYGAVEKSALEVYHDIFRLGEHYIQQSGEYGEKNYKGNPVAYYKNQHEATGHFRVLLEDTFSETLIELQNADFAILNGLAYLGRRNLQVNATKMFSMIIDLDGVTDNTLNNFLYAAAQKGRFVFPMPNYIVLSGHGVHLYYVFKEPINLYPYLKLQLKEFKYALTKKIWNEKTSTDEHIQYQGINQGFRVIGGKTKLDGVVLKAFKMPQEKYPLSELCKYVPPENRVDETKLFKESKYSLAEAKKKFPDWYERVIENKGGTEMWDLSAKVHGKDPYAVYNWWLNRIKAEAQYHHRYFDIMMLAIYAIKCRLPYKQLEADALSLIPAFDNIFPDDPFTEADVRSALECYDLKYCTFPIRDIEKLSGLVIPRNRRNGRSQADHMRLMRLIRDEINQNKDWYNKNGAPTKEHIVKEYRRQNASGSMADCCRVTGLSRPTVKKWWNVVDDTNET